MINFQFYNPCRLINGIKEIDNVGKYVKKYSNKILLHYGSGSIFKNGVYERVMESFKKENIEVFQLGGVQPNPTLDLVYEGIRICKENQISFVLAVGGGSVIDSGKAIACGALYDGDVWDLFGGYKAERWLPIGCVLTLPASGSEASDCGVVTNEKTQEKFYIGSKDFFPVFSIIDPEVFVTVPKKHIAAGAMDMISHVLERYFSNTEATEYVDSLCEQTVKNVIRLAPVLMRNSTDYDSWMEYSLCGTFAQNGMLGLGLEADWSNHRIEDQMAAIFDITHGEGLSVICLAWMRYVYKINPRKLLKFAKNIMMIEDQGDDYKTIEVAIDELEKWMKMVNLPTTMQQLNIPESSFETMARKATFFNTKKQKTIGHYVKLQKDDIVNIYRIANQQEVKTNGKLGNLF